MNSRDHWPGVVALIVALLSVGVLLFWNLLIVVVTRPEEALLSVRDVLCKYLSPWMTDAEFWLRIVAVVIAVVALWFHGHILARPHSTFRQEKVISKDVFQQLMGDELLKAMKQSEGKPTAYSDRIALYDLVAQVVLERTRLFVREEVAIQPAALDRLVHIESKVPDGRNFLIVSKPRKGSNLRDFRMESEGLRIVSFARTQGLLFRAGVLLWRAVAGSDPEKDQELLIMACVAAADESERKDAVAALGDAASLISPLSTNALRVLEAFATVVAERRIILAESLGPSDALKECRFRYAETVLKPDEGKPVPVTRWRSRSRRVRAWWGAAPKVISIPLQRALTSRRYLALVDAPRGTYVRDVGIWDFDKESWYPGLDREKFFTMFVGYRVFPGMHRVQAVISSSGKVGERVVETPRLAVRISEIPPGSIGGGALMSGSVWLLVWLYGVFFPDGSSSYFDLATVALALPSTIFAVFALRTRESPYASLTARFSSFLAMGLSFLAILLMVAGQKWPALLADTNMAKSVMLVDNGLWLLLATVALVNAVWSVLDLMRAFARYKALRKEESNSYDKE